MVINKEKEGFAHSHYITHGPSVAAIGLKVESAAAALDRAEKLCDTPFRQKVGPGELEIPAVRGVGGSLVYFLDPTSKLGKVWDVEFEPTAAPQKDSRRWTDDGRPYLAIDALRGHAVLAAFLHVAA